MLLIPVRVPQPPTKLKKQVIKTVLLSGERQIWVFLADVTFIVPIATRKPGKLGKV